MLRTNLSTHPFYNIRAVQVALGALGVLVILMTLVNLFQLVRLTSSERALGAKATQAEADAARLREEAQRIRSQINAKELTDVAAAAQEANAIIDMRTFSWSDLFAQLEATLPESVRLTSFQTREDSEGRFQVGIRVQARRVQDLEAFMEALEKTGMFHDVLAADEQTDPDGLIDAMVEGVYTPPPKVIAPANAATESKAGGVAGE
jgi:Tfp pilus assembly protein PilN